jgi:hypothetical protein
MSRPIFKTWSLKFSSEECLLGVELKSEYQSSRSLFGKGLSDSIEPL